MSYNPAIAQQILDDIENGKSLRVSAVECGLRIKTFYEWMDLDAEVNENLTQRYTAARARAYHAMADEIIEISNQMEAEAIYQGDTVRLDLSSAVVAQKRLQVETRKWILSKMLPKQFGDKLDITQTGEVQFVGSINISTLGDEELKQEITKKMLALGLYKPDMLAIDVESKEVLPEDVIDLVEINKSMGDIDQKPAKQHKAKGTK